MERDLKEILLTEEQIQNKIRELADQITAYRHLFCNNNSRTLDPFQYLFRCGVIIYRNVVGEDRVIQISVEVHFFCV